ncbi:MAG: hypothetical protein ACOX4R_06080 [Lentihominibacter sp.]
MERIVLVSHCVLNSMCELPPAPDEYRKGLLQIAGENKWEIIQLPCPELCYQSLARESIYPNTEKAKKYKEYCVELLAPLLNNLHEYKKAGYSITGIIGIETSPSCSIKLKEGIMMDLLLEFFRANGMACKNTINMPIESGDTNFLTTVKEWI